MPIETMENETCFLLTGRTGNDFWIARRTGSRREGSSASVSFDPGIVLRREEVCKDVVGFWHTHPSFPAVPSPRDDRTMGAWVNCLGRSLLCLIEGLEGGEKVLRAWWYDNDDEPPAECEAEMIGYPTETDDGFFVGSVHPMNEWGLGEGEDLDERES